MVYEVLKGSYVIETLAKGTTVIACDFSTMRMTYCTELTVKAINTLVSKDSVVFYKAVASE